MTPPPSADPVGEDGAADTAGSKSRVVAVSRDLLGLTSPLADNVSANVVGMAIATAFRFWTFRTYVFPVRPAS